jgi:hypothetical protein
MTVSPVDDVSAGDPQYRRQSIAPVIRIMKNEVPASPAEHSAFFDGSRHDGTRVFWNSRGIWFHFRHSCGPGPSRLRHFLIDAGISGVAGLYSGSSYAAHTHDDIGREAALSHFARLRVFVLILT